MNTVDGQLTIKLETLGGTARANVSCQRPATGRALIGLSPCDALNRIAHLYALCPAAQQQAAALALGLPSPVSRQQAAQEWIREHSWQLWLMLNTLGLGEEALAATIALRQGAWRDPEAASLFGLTPRQWLALSSETDLEQWSKTKAPYAQLLAFLRQPKRRGFGNPTAPVAALRRCADHPLLAIHHTADGALVQHTLARLVELARLLSSELLPPAPKPLADGSIEVEAPRGRLRHRASLAWDNDGRALVRDYDIESPTDRLCRPNGELARSLNGVTVTSNSLRDAHLLILALGPCIPFTLVSYPAKETADA